MSKSELPLTKGSKKALNKNLRTAWISLIISGLIIIFDIWFILQFINSIQDPANDPWPQFIVVIVMFFIPFVGVLMFISALMLFIGIYSIIRYRRIKRILIDK
jgi:hypothetical protein